MKKVRPTYKSCIGNKSVDKIVLHRCDDVCKVVKDSFTKPMKRNYPTVLVGCSAEKGRYLYIETSYSEFPDYNKTTELQDKLSTLGPIGSVRSECKYKIGSCAEPKAAYQAILDTNSSMRLLRFSTAFRPRTKERIPYCRNCKDTFGL